MYNKAVELVAVKSVFQIRQELMKNTSMTSNVSDRHPKAMHTKTIIFKAHGFPSYHCKSRGLRTN